MPSEISQLRPLARATEGVLRMSYTPAPVEIGTSYWLLPIWEMLRRSYPWGEGLARAFNFYNQEPVVVFEVFPRLNGG